MDLSSTRWLVALVPVAILTEAQHFGTFVHETAFYTMSYDVEENYELTFGFNLSVEIESESHVGIAATCGWRYTPYVRFNLKRRSRTLYDHYDVVPAGEVTLEEFRQM
ncbi:hypothetical protein FOZ61_010258, partial [Perkinsus olseni]